jgi:hypothetical protein
MTAPTNQPKTRIDTAHQRGSAGVHGRVRRLATALDTAIRIPGTGIRFGIDPIIGLLPGVGDVLGGVLSTYIIFEAILARASSPVLMRMVLNTGLDMLLAAVPIVGDAFDFSWRSNTRNLRLLQRHLENPDEAAAASRAFILLLIAIVLGFCVVTLLLAVWAIRVLFAALGG